MTYLFFMHRKIRFIKVSLLYCTLFYHFAPLNPFLEIIRPQVDSFNWKFVETSRGVGEI